MTCEAPSNAVFRAAWAWNLFWGLPLLLAPNMAMSSIGMPEPNQGIRELHARAVGLAVVLFGWIYLTIGRDPVAYRSFLQIAIGAKLFFFLLVAIVSVRHRELVPMLLIAVGDLMFGGLFLRVWRRNR